MSSRERKREALYEKFQQLRSITNSRAVNQASIIVDAANYIEELKRKVERLNQDISRLQPSTDANYYGAMQVRVEALKKGFQINVLSENNCPGLLVSVLEAFEKLGLDVLDTKVSCSDNFSLEAIGENEDEAYSLDAQILKQAVLQAIKNWSGGCERD